MRYQVTEFTEKGARLNFFNVKATAFAAAQEAWSKQKNKVLIYDSKARKNGGDQTWAIKPCGHIEVIAKRNTAFNFRP
jgi:hypothetical protein